MGPKIEELTEAYIKKVFNNLVLLFKSKNERNQKKKNELKKMYSENSRRIEKIREKITAKMRPEEKIRFSALVNKKSTNMRIKFLIKTPEGKKKRKRARKMYSERYA